MTKAASLEIIAHRGNSSVAPENTLAAFASAIAAGADCIEIDVSYTRDGEIVVIHDDTLERTTNGTGAVREAALEQVRSLDAGTWFAPAYAGQWVPTLAEFADLLSGYEDVAGLIELKGRWSSANIAQVVEIVSSAGISERTILQSFHAHTLARLHDLASHLRRGVLAVDDVESLIPECAAAGVHMLNPHVDYVEQNPDIIARIHEAGLLVQVWTVNEPEKWAFLQDLGVDGIITDRPDALAGWLST